MRARNTDSIISSYDGDVVAGNEQIDRGSIESSVKTAPETGSEQILIIDDDPF